MNDIKLPARTPIDFILDEIGSEVLRAQVKFPQPNACTVALMEEVGELAKAMLEESLERVRAEAVQVAAMAIRCALEGDPTLNFYRHQHGATLFDMDRMEMARDFFSQSTHKSAEAHPSASRSGGLSLYCKCGWMGQRSELSIYNNGDGQEYPCCPRCNSLYI